MAEVPGPLPPNARILLIRLSALGDIVFALPALHALRHLLPQARVDWLVEDRHADLLEGHPAVDEVVVFPRRIWKDAHGLGRLRALGAVADHLMKVRERGRYDLVLDLQGNLKSAMHLLFARGERTLGLEKPGSREGARRFYRTRVPDPGRVHRSERDLALVRALGYTGPPPPPAAWALDRQVEQEIDLRLGHELSVPPRARPGGPLVVLHTDVTSYGQDKEWPRERWLALAGRLADGHGARVLLLWHAKNRGAVLSMVEDSEGACGLAPPTPSLQHLMALTDRADALVGTDSGPVHLAAYRGTRVVALFGPTDALRYRPPGPHVRLLSALPMDEEPPARDRSGPSPLMRKLTVEQVAAAVADSLGA